MKPVALWQVELHHTKDWDRLHMLDRVMEALYFLKSCVESENLPAYFIPENNLFDGKLNPCMAHPLSGLLNNLLSQGTRCVLTFPSIQQQLHIMQIPGLRRNFGVRCNGLQMINLMYHFCRQHLRLDLSMKHIFHIISLMNSPDMARHRLLTKGISKIINIIIATLAYVNIANFMKTKMSNRRKYELCRLLLVIASTNSNTAKMTKIIKFAGVLLVLGKTTKAIVTLDSIKQRPLVYIGNVIFGISSVKCTAAQNKTRIMFMLLLRDLAETNMYKNVYH
ncbi:hypothetical protein ACJMK2_032661 [Sinanodonta woodiana]|uniref:Mab-21-like HhH/H2TH-like domain-containing protein n=1 Tax=Sinanodonta woodiana TaxID=1069815 RepID=A0ABD3X6G3_SINWO